MKRITTSGVAIIEDDKVILLHKMSDDHYEFPGGKVESGESLEEAAIREAKEEVGCNVDLLQKYGPYTFSKQDIKITSYVFTAKIREGQKVQIMEPAVFDRLDRVNTSSYEKKEMSPIVAFFLEDFNN